jgi:TRAP-type C4-dicarboxylate transport system permease small subunit
MNAVKIVAVILIAAGTLGLVYGGFSYTQETHKVDVGPINMSIEEKERVNVPVWAGIGAIVVGAALLLFRSKNG